MCWSAEVSLNTFLFAAFVSGLGLWNGAFTLPYVLGLLTFSSMQLLEYFMWTHIGNAAKVTLLSKLGMLLIFLQPLAFMMRIEDVATRGYATAAYLLFAAVYLMWIRPLHQTRWNTRVAKNGHLQWEWLTAPFWAAFIWVCFLACHNLFVHKDMTQAFIRMGIFFFIPFIISYVLYAQHGTWGSVWCHISNLVFAWFLFKMVSGRCA